MAHETVECVLARFWRLLSGFYARLLRSPLKFEGGESCVEALFGVFNSCFEASFGFPLLRDSGLDCGLRVVPAAFLLERAIRISFFSSVTRIRPIRRLNSWLFSPNSRGGSGIGLRSIGFSFRLNAERFLHLLDGFRVRADFEAIRRYDSLHKALSSCLTVVS